MIKIVPSGSFDFGMPVASLMQVWSGGVDRDYLQKRASIAFKELTKNLKKEAGHSYIHLISLGDYETYGSNRNGDSFNARSALWTLPEPKEGLAKRAMLGGGLEKYHSTFVKRGHVFKHHKNDDPTKNIGSIETEFYNPDMHRGELIIKVANNHPDWKNELNDLANGKDIPYSMACKIAADMCMICGNRARHKREYCVHANDLTSMWKTGHINSVMNDEPIFFDISKVFRPADRIAYSLQKVASDGHSSGVDLAAAAGLDIAPYWLEAERPTGASRYYLSKLAIANKLAAIEKTVDAMAGGEENKQLSALSHGVPDKDIPQEAMKSMSGCKSCDALQAMGDAKICLSLPDFFKLTMGSKVDSSDVKEAALNVRGMFSRMLNFTDVAAASDYDFEPKQTLVKQAVLWDLMAAHSLGMNYVTKRAELAAIRQASPVLIKTASAGTVNKKAEYLTKEYAKYVLSFVHANTNEGGTNELTVLQGYIRV